MTTEELYLEDESEEGWLLSYKLQKYVALAHLGSDWYSGQFSRGYKLMCLASKRLRKYGIDRPIDIELEGYALEVYERLQDEYGKKGKL